MRKKALWNILPWVMVLVVILVAEGMRDKGSRTSLSDPEIEARVERVLREARTSSGDRVRARARHRVVTLTGEVGTPRVREEAESLVRAVEGVRDVVNRIRVRTKIPAPSGARYPVVEPPETLLVRKSPGTAFDA